MKGYTSLPQSKKLAEFLPLESADMHWQYIEEDNGQLQWFCFPKDFSINQHNTISAWSLAALLDVLPNGIVMNKDSQNGRYHFSSKYVGTYVTADNPIDACYEMILKLHELKML